MFNLFPKILIKKSLRNLEKFFIFEQDGDIILRPIYILKRLIYKKKFLEFIMEWIVFVAYVVSQWYKSSAAIKVIDLIQIVFR